MNRRRAMLFACMVVSMTAGCRHLDAETICHLEPVSNAPGTYRAGCGEGWTVQTRFVRATRSAYRWGMTRGEVEEGLRMADEATRGPPPKQSDGLPLPEHAPGLWKSGDVGMLRDEGGAVVVGFGDYSNGIIVRRNADGALVASYWIH